jgi:hypothetical protein
LGGEARLRGPTAAATRLPVPSTAGLRARRPLTLPLHPPAPPQFPQPPPQHCVYDRDSDTTLSSATFTPHRFFDAAGELRLPFGSSASASFDFLSGYRTSDSEDEAFLSDQAVILLRDPLGAKAGRLGLAYLEEGGSYRGRVYAAGCAGRRRGGGAAGADGAGLEGVAAVLARAATPHCAGARPRRPCPRLSTHPLSAPSRPLLRYPGETPHPWGRYFRLAGRCDVSDDSGGDRTLDFRPRHQRRCLSRCAIAEEGQSGQPAYVAVGGGNSTAGRSSNGTAWAVLATLSSGPETGTCRGYDQYVQNDAETFRWLEEYVAWRPASN